MKYMVITVYVLWIAIAILDWGTEKIKERTEELRARSGRAE